MEKEETTAYEDISGLDATVYEDHDQDDDETGQLYEHYRVPVDKKQKMIRN